MLTVVAGYLVAVVALSLLTFVCYGWDKSCAVRGARRVPESTLHLLSLLGGWPGALVGQQHFRHKTRKWSFQSAFWLTVVMHCGGVGAVVVTGDPASLPGILWPKIAPQPAADEGPIITPLPRRAKAS